MDGFRTRCTGSLRPHDKWMLKWKWRLSLNSLYIWYVEICRELWIPAELEYSTHYIMIYIVWFSKFLLYVFVVPWCKVLRCPSRARQGDQPQCINLIQHVTCHPWDFRILLHIYFCFDAGGNFVETSPGHPAIQCWGYCLGTSLWCWQRREKLWKLQLEKKQYKIQDL